MSQPTISDVARAAGVSVATVSRALRGLDKVHPETRERVLQAAAELNYIASPTAAGLASGRTQLVGVLTPFMARWYFTEILSSLEKTLRHHRQHILLMDLEESRSIGRLSVTEGMMFKRIDGLLVLNIEMSETEIEIVRRLELPVVAVGSRYADAPLIGIDDVGCAATATEHLVGLGHRQIAYLGSLRDDSAHRLTPVARRQGFEDTMQRHGLTVRPDWIVPSDWSADDARVLARRLLESDDRPSAIQAASDEMAYGVMAAARDLGLRIPDDLSVIGIDDHDLADVFALTTVRQDVEAQGVGAAEALLAQLGLADPALATDRIFPVELIQRATTAAPA